MDIKQLLELSVSKHASDLHILPGLTPLLRVDGNLSPIKNMAPLTAEESKNLIYTVLTDEQKAIKATIFSIIGNTCLALIKGLAGFFGNSYALIADAIESTTDIFSSSIAADTLSCIESNAFQREFFLL